MFARHAQGDGDGILIAEACGPFAWSVIHNTAESFPCAPCAEEGGSLMRFAHDLVNHNLGKPVVHRDDFKRWSDVVLEAGAGLNLFAVRDGAPPAEPLPEDVGVAVEEMWSNHLGQGTRPPCDGDQADAFERCVLEVKEDPNVDNPFAVCTASIGCVA